MVKIGEISLLYFIDKDIGTDYLIKFHQKNVVQRENKCYFWLDSIAFEANDFHLLLIYIKNNQIPNEVFDDMYKMFERELNGFLIGISFCCENEKEQSVEIIKLLTELNFNKNDILTKLVRKRYENYKYIYDNI